MAQDPHIHGLEVLEPDECVRQLKSHYLGRLAVTIDDQPLIFPVNYTVTMANDVIFRTGPGTKLHSAVGRRVAFEIDGTDLQYHTGWSVLLTGIAVEEHDQQRLQEFATLPLGPWVPGPTSHWISIRTDSLSGRRIVRYE